MIPLIPAALALSLVASPSTTLEKPDWTPVVASAILPGSGQWLEGQPPKAIGQFGAALACLASLVYAQNQSSNTTGVAGATPNVRIFATAGLAGLAIWSPLDAWLFQQRPTTPGTLASQPSGGK